MSPGTSAPVGPANAVIAGQPTTHFAIQDPARVEQDLAAAKVAQAAAVQELGRVRETTRYHRVRLWAAGLGVPRWALALIAGSGGAVALATALIFLLGVGAAALGAAALSAAILFAYVVCGGAVLWYLRPMNGENGDNTLEVRTEQVKLAEGNQLAAIELVREKKRITNQAQQLLQAILQTLQSDAYKYQMETNRLLSIDPGRLYPDEFERYVAAIFRHLGFTIEVTGQSGDQGVDVLACRGPFRLAIQAKRYIGAVGNSAIQEVYAGMAHHKCHRCIVVTNSSFTPGAVGLAQSTGCLLIGADRMGPLIRGEIAL